MIGGLKGISRAALVAGALSLGSFGAQAADFGGNCCADLEERVAELEATTARKGTRVMSLTITGNVGSQVIWHDSDAADAERDEQFTIQDQGEFSNSLTFRGAARVSSDLRVGFLLDFAAPMNRSDAVTVDDSYVFLESATLGEIRIGTTDGAADGIHSISLANNIGQMTDNSHSAAIGTQFAVRNDFDGHGTGAGVRYISPTLAGFIFQASYLHQAGNSDLDTTNDGEQWAVALRYAGEFGPIRVAAGVGYSSTDDTLKALGLEDEFIATLSLMHTPTGLFLNGSYGFADTDGVIAPNLSDETGWTIVAGIEQKFFALGATTIWGQYYSFDKDDDDGIGSGDGYSWGLGIAQAIDAGSMSIYAQYDRYECVGETVSTTASTCVDDANVFTSGINVKF